MVFLFACWLEPPYGLERLEHGRRGGSDGLLALVDEECKWIGCTSTDEKGVQVTLLT